MDLKTRGVHAHTSGPSACHPLDRSATLLLTHGARADFAISIAGLANHQFCVPEAESLCVCCSCAALCAVCCAGCDVLVLTRRANAQFAAIAVMKSCSE